MAGLDGFHHVKIPVSDLTRSIAWYGRVLDLRVAIRFVESGVLRGVAIRDPAGTLMLALREDADRATRLAGFDPLALGVSTLAELGSWASRLDGLGVAHSGIVEGSAGWLIGGLTDPDGMEVRLYTRQPRV
ncbi:MAG TPA: VOC family protein [Mycobacteriales bacterium]|nr:VOC family protein [Mycobacteriales bacterium]